MKLRFGRILVLLAGLSAAMFVNSAQGQVDTNTYLFVAHAASGRTHIPGGNPAFPIDIKLNGVCISKGQTYGEIRGPFTAPAGTLSFEVSVANSVDPCSNPTIFSGSNPFSAGTTYLGILTLDSSDNLMGQIYPADLASIPATKSRLIVANASQQDLSAVLTIGTFSQTASIPKSSVMNFLPAAGLYTATITSGGKTQTGPIDVTLQQRNASFYVLTGSTSNGTVQIIGPKVIWGVF